MVVPSLGVSVGDDPASLSGTSSSEMSSSEMSAGGAGDPDGGRRVEDDARPGETAPSSRRDAADGVTRAPDAWTASDPAVRDAAGKTVTRPPPDAASDDTDAAGRDGSADNPGSEAGGGGETGGGEGGLCPSSAPTGQSWCTTAGLLCVYATEDCTCQDTWTCVPCPPLPPTSRTSCTATGATCHYAEENVACTCDPDGWDCAEF
jgi:hypothetical protein